MTKKLTSEQSALVEKNVDLAHYLARVVWRSSSYNLELEELVSIAYQGLIIAAQRWDPERDGINPEDLENGKAFSGYARHRIIGKIQDWQRYEDHVQRNYRTTYKKIRSCGLDDGVPVREIADRLGLDYDYVDLVIRTVESPPVSLQTPVSSGRADAGFSEMGSTISGEADVESEAGVRNAQSALVREYRNLDRCSQVVVALHYYSNIGLRKISDALGLTPARVGEIHGTAILALHEALRLEMEER